VLRKAEQATPLYNVERLTVKPKGGAHRIFVDHKPLQYRLTSAKARTVLDSLSLYRGTLLPERQHFFDQYRPLDVAFRVVGTGSVGLRDYVIYLEGNGSEDPLFLQIKEEPGSAYAPYLGEIGLPQHQGRRVAQGQRAMQLLSDVLLGWTTIENRQYLVRQLNDHKASIEMGDLKGEGLLQYAEICGELLARGHARSGDALALAGYIGNSDLFVDAIGAFARDYADQTEADYQVFLHSRFVHKKKMPPARKPKLKPAAVIKESKPRA
jgi:hypothetical protein